MALAGNRVERYILSAHQFADTAAPEQAVILEGGIQNNMERYPVLRDLIGRESTVLRRQTHEMRAYRYKDIIYILLIVRE